MFPWLYTLDVFRAVLYEITAHAQHTEHTVLRKEIICVLCFVKEILVRQGFCSDMTVQVTALVRDICISFVTRRKLEFCRDIPE